MALNTILSENERGKVHIEGHALIADSTIADAGEIRVGSPVIPGVHSGGGKYSIDDTRNVDADGRGRREIAYLGCGDGVFGPELSLNVLKKDALSEDINMIRLFRATAAEGIEFTVPVRAPGGIATVTDRMTSINGRFVTIQQGDGNFVTYDRELGPVGDPAAAIWSAWGGKV